MPPSWTSSPSLVRGVDCYRLTMGELDGAVDLVAGLLGVTPDREPVP